MGSRSCYSLRLIRPGYIEKIQSTPITIWFLLFFLPQKPSPCQSSYNLETARTLGINSVYAATLRNAPSNPISLQTQLDPQNYSKHTGYSTLVHTFSNYYNLRTKNHRTRNTAPKKTPKCILFVPLYEKTQFRSKKLILVLRLIWTHWDTLFHMAKSK